MWGGRARGRGVGRLFIRQYLYPAPGMEESLVKVCVCVCVGWGGLGERCRVSLHQRSALSFLLSSAGVPGAW